MSLANLCSISSASIARKAYTNGSAMGADFTYTAAARAGLPTTSTGRLNQNGAFRRFAYDEHDQEIDSVWYTVTNPQCDERDQLTVGTDIYFVQAQRNPDNVSKFFRLELKLFGRNIQ